MNRMKSRWFYEGPVELEELVKFVRKEKKTKPE